MSMRVIVVLAAAAVWPPAAAAQQAPPPPPAREGKIEMALVATSGNAQTQSIGVAGEATLRPDAWVLTVKAGFVRNEADGVVNAKSLRSLGRAARVIRPGVEAFAQHAYLRDRFSGVDHRNSLDAGLSYRLVDTARHELFADGGIGYLNERRTIGDNLSTALGTAGTRYTLRLSETSNVTDELLLAFDVAERGTWRLNHAAAVTAQMTALLALKLSNLLRFVNEPVTGFERTDTVTSASLVLSF